VEKLGEKSCGFPFLGTENLIFRKSALERGGEYEREVKRSEGLLPKGEFACPRGTSRPESGIEGTKALERRYSDNTLFGLSSTGRPRQRGHAKKLPHLIRSKLLFAQGTDGLRTGV